MGPRLNYPECSCLMRYYCAEANKINLEGEDFSMRREKPKELNKILLTHIRGSKESTGRHYC
jgi:hypothetical protein